MVFTKSIRKVNEELYRLFGRIEQEEAVIPVIEECEHLILGICALLQRKILVVFVVLDKCEKIRYLQHLGCGSVRNITVVGAVSDPRDHDEESDDHLLIVISKRREREGLDHVGIRSEELIETEILIEICGDRIPPVEEEVLKRYIILIEVRKRGLKVR